MFVSVIKMLVAHVLTLSNLYTRQRNQVDITMRVYTFVCHNPLPLVFVNASFNARALQHFVPNDCLVSPCLPPPFVFMSNVTYGLVIH